MKLSFKNFLAIYVVVLMCLLCAVCAYIRISVNKYETTQPEKIINGTIEEIIKSANEKTFTEHFVLPEKKLSVYDGIQSEDSLNDEFFAMVLGVEQWSFEVMSGGYTDKLQIYGVYGDGELIANVSLNCKSSKIVMGFLSINDWEVKGIYPGNMLNTQNLIVDIPVGYTAYANDCAIVSGDAVSVDEKDGSVIYVVSGLYELPEVVVKNRVGEICTTTNNDGVITVDAIAYSMILPESFTVYENEKKVEGEIVENGVRYSFLSDCYYLTIEDAYGQQIKYQNGDSVFANNLTIELPSNFIVEFGDNDMNNYIVNEEKQKRYEECENYADMPALITYEINESIIIPELVVYDNLGNRVDYSFDNNSLIITEQTTKATLDENIALEVNPIEIMKKLVLLTTDNLGTEEHGFRLLEPFLIKESVLYTYIYKWTHGQADIAFANRASTHQFPEIIREEVEGFVRYSENAFSCDVHITSKFYIYSIYDYEYINLNSTCYFVKINGEWKLADYREIIDED